MTYSVTNMNRILDRAFKTHGSWEEVAKASDLSTMTLSSLRDGNLPSMLTFEKILGVTGKKPNAFFEA